MTVCELLENNPDPSEEEVRDALGGQICRCTGYRTILRSVNLAAARLRGAHTAGSAEHS